ncbi:MAG: hypothetical protein ACRBDX_08140 [Gammaproteobacteria bacterium]
MKTKILIIIFTTLCVSFMSLGGCASKHKKQKTLSSFDERIRLYGRLLRWKEYEGAVNLIRYQDESSVEIDLEAYKDLRVTDYEIKKVVMGDELKTAEVEAEIAYYFETTNAVKTIRDKQSWWYKEETETWFLDDDLPAF